MDKTQHMTSLCQKTVLLPSERVSCKRNNDRPSVENAVITVETKTADNNNKDNRKSNHGSGQHSRHSNKFKATMIEFYESECCEENVTKLVKEHRLENESKKMLSLGK